MKRIALFLLVVILGIAFCACTESEQNPDPTIESVPDPTVESVPDPTMENIPAESGTNTLPSAEATENNTEIEASSFRITSRDDFHSGRAWIGFYEDDVRYWGVIDTSGNIIVKFETDSSIYVDPYFDGYASIHLYRSFNDNIEYIIDKDGTITYQGHDYSFSQRSGYFAITEDLSDFYATSYKYTIHGPDGSIIEEFISENSYTVTNLGRGIFYFPGKGFFCAESRQWLTEEDCTGGNYCSWNLDGFQHEEESAILVGCYGNPDIYLFLYPDGTLAQITLPDNIRYFEWSRFSPVVNDTVCVFDPATDTFATINVKTKEMSFLGEEYAKKATSTHAGMPNCNRILLTLEGADGESYVFCFNMNWNLVYGPVEPFQLRGGYESSRIIYGNNSNDRVVWDENGNVVFSLRELGYTNYVGVFTQSQYSSGMLLVTSIDNNDKTRAYIDCNGNVLDTFNSENAITIKIK